MINNLMNIEDEPHLDKDFLEIAEKIKKIYKKFSFF